MSPTIICIDDRHLGWNREIGHGFHLGLLPLVLDSSRMPLNADTKEIYANSSGMPNRYGITWHRGSKGLGGVTHWVEWPLPHLPISIEFEGQAFVFCTESSTESQIQQATRKSIESVMEVR